MTRNHPPHVTRVLTVLVVLAGVAGTCEADQTPAPTPMSLNLAIQKALTNDPAIKLATLNLETARIEYERRQSAAVAGGTKSSGITNESDLESAMLAHVRSVDDAILGVIDDAFALEVATLRATAKESSVEKSRKALALVAGRKASGAADTLDELAARADLNSAQAALFAAGLSTEQAAERLRIRLGLPEGQSVAINELPTFQTYRPPDDARSRARSADPDLVKKEAAVSLAQLDLDKVRASAAAPLDIRGAENRLAVARAELAKARDDLDALVDDDLNAVAKAGEDYQSATMSLDLAVERHDIILAQRSTGGKSDLDILSDTVQLDESRASRLEALEHYVKALLSLEVLMGRDLQASPVPWIASDPAAAPDLTPTPDRRIAPDLPAATSGRSAARGPSVGDGPGNAGGPRAATREGHVE